MNKKKKNHNIIILLNMTEGPSFVYKVYSILEVIYKICLKQSDYDDIVSWNDDGDGFEVKNIGIF